MKKGVTTKINHLYELAKEENDYLFLQVHLQWFIDEQVEEEEPCRNIGYVAIYRRKWKRYNDVRS